VLDGATGILDEQWFDGPWLIAGADSRHIGFQWIFRRQWVFDAETGKRRCDISGQHIHGVARRGRTLIRTERESLNRLLGDLEFFDIESGEQTGAYRPYICEFEAISPDGDTVAVTTYHD